MKPTPAIIKALENELDALGHLIKREKKDLKQNQITIKESLSLIQELELEFNEILSFIENNK